MGERRSGWLVGCTIAAVVLGGGGLACALVFGLVLWKAAPGIERGYDLVSESIDITREAMRGPGTDEMRRAGCDDAMAFTPELMERFVRAIEPDGGPERVPTQPILACLVRGDRPAPDCGAIVRVYAGAVSPVPSEMVMRVTGEGGTRDVRCDGVFAPDGTRLRDIGADERRVLGHTGAAP